MSGIDMQASRGRSPRFYNARRATYRVKFCALDNQSDAHVLRLTKERGSLLEDVSVKDRGYSLWVPLKTMTSLLMTGQCDRKRLEVSWFGRARGLDGVNLQTVRV